MKRVLTSALIATSAMLLIGANPAPVKTTKGAVKAESNGAGHHDLLALGVREATEHARVLNHYARTYARNLERDVVTRHTDELTRNLDGIRHELSNVEHHMGPYVAATEPRLALIERQEALARRELEALKLANATDTLNPALITELSRRIYDAILTADAHHRKVMAKRGVRGPAGMVTRK